MQRAKKPFQEKRIQSRPQSYSAFRTKRTTRLATVSSCKSTEATDGARWSDPFIHLFLSRSGHNWVFSSSPPTPFFFLMLPRIVFLLEISVADHKQNPKWFACRCAKGAASDGAGERSNKARCLFHLSSRGESQQRTKKCGEKKRRKEKKNLQHLSDVRFLTDSIRPRAPDKLPLIQRLTDWLTDCAACPPGCWSAAAITDGTSHFLIPGGLEFNLSRAPSGAKSTRVWVHPKRLWPRTEMRFAVCGNGAPRERWVRTREARRRAEYFLSITDWDDVSP